MKNKHISACQVNECLLTVISEQNPILLYNAYIKLEPTSDFVCKHFRDEQHFK